MGIEASTKIARMILVLTSALLGCRGDRQEDLSTSTQMYPVHIAGN